MIGLILSPVLNLGESSINCKQDMILAHEQLGAYLSEIIPSNSLVYWDGGNAFTPMVYVPNVRIFPVQINDGYTYRIGGDPETLHRFSHWNSELNEEWKNSADVFIIEAKRFSSWKDFLTPQDFEEYAPAPPPPSTSNATTAIKIMRIRKTPYYYSSFMNPNINHNP